MSDRNNNSANNTHIEYSNSNNDGVAVGFFKVMSETTAEEEEK